MIARAVYDERVLCGSSAIAEESPVVWGLPPARQEQQGLPPRKSLGILVTAGSLMPQTAAQIEHLKQKGAPAFVLDTSQLFATAQRESHIAGLSRAISA